MRITNLDYQQSSQTHTTNCYSKHPAEPGSPLCDAENCHQRFVCCICSYAYHSQKRLIPSDELKDFKLLALLGKASQEEGPENAKAAFQQAETIQTDLKKELDGTFEELKKSTLELK